MAWKGVQLGFLKYVLGFDSLQFKKGISDADADLVKLQKKFAAKGKEFQNLGKSLSSFITLPLAGLAAAGIKEAQETATAMAQVNAALASMGPVAGRTAEQLQKAANAFEGKSLFEADEILKDVTANMLTFGNISGQAFDQAQQAAIDLATRFNTDLKSATILVGKALNDPIQGLTALRRVGVQLTEQQQEQVKAMTKAGDIAGAQAIILGELRREVGGAAAAAQNADPWNKLSDSFKNIAESIGTLLLPLIPPLANALASVANFVSSLDPTTQKWVVGIGALVAALGPALIILGNVVAAVGQLGPLVIALTKGWGLLTTGLTLLGPVIATVGRALLALLGNPVLLGAALVIIGIYEAWKHWDEISAIAKRVYTAVKTWLLDKLGAVWSTLKGAVEGAIAPFKKLYDAVVGHSYVPDMVEGIGVWMQKLDPLMVQPAKAAASATGEALAGMNAPVKAANDDIVVSAKMTSDQVIKAYGDMAEGVVRSISDMVHQLKHGDILGALQTVLGAVKGVLDTLVNVGVLHIGGAKATPRANGGPVVPGRTYLVGENGPEYVRFGQRGYVTPPKGATGASRVTVVPSPYFDLVVDGRAASVAAPMAGQAAVVGAAGGVSAVRKTASRRFP